MYTAHPLLPKHVKGASIAQIKWWLDLPAPVAKALHAQLKQLSDVTLDSIAVALRASVLAASNAGEVHVDEAKCEQLVLETMRRFTTQEMCDAYLAQAKQMVELIVPFRSLAR